MTIKRMRLTAHLSLGQALPGQDLLGHASFELMRVLQGGSMGLLRWFSLVLAISSVNPATRGPAVPG